MSILRLFSVFVTVIFTSACVSIPPTPAFDLAPNAKVAYQVDISEAIGHKHVGTTVFNNFDRPKPDMNWQLNDFAKEEAKRLLELYGFEPVEVQPFVSSVSKKLVEEHGEEYSVKLSDEQVEQIQREHDAYYQGLVNDGIGAIVGLQSNFVFPAYSECGAYGCTDFYMEFSGLFTRSVVFLPAQIYASLPTSSFALLTEPVEVVQVTKMPEFNYAPNLIYMKDKRLAMKNMLNII